MANYNNPNDEFAKTPIDTVIEFFNSSTFLKIYPDSFGIGKLKLAFGQFDTNNKKLKNNIDFYLEVKKGDVLVLCQDILSGRLSAEMEKEKKTRLSDSNIDEKAKQYAKPVRMYQGGVSAKKAKRKDNMALSKVLEISSGAKKPVVFTCKEGPGEQNAKGLIVPRFNNSNAEKRIIVALTMEELKAMALAVQAYYNAWLSAAFSVKLFAEERKKKNQSKSKPPNNNFNINRIEDIEEVA